MPSSIRRLLVPLAASALGTAPVLAQDVVQLESRDRQRYAVGVMGGLAQFDLAGTGDAFLISARAEAELQRWLVAEAAIGMFQPDEQFGRRLRYVVPEAQLQLQLPGARVRPYLGAGGGFVLANGAGGDSEITASLAGGFRVGVLGTRADARGELRVRGIGSSFTGSTAEWTFGGTYRFGSRRGTGL